MSWITHWVFTKRFWGLAYLWLALYRVVTITIFMTLQVLAFLFIYFIKCLVPLTLIFSNPEQSKHLETARMRLFDMWIDFVNLRSEEYSDNSRIPTKVYSFCTFSLCFSMIIWNKSKICYISGHFCPLCVVCLRKFCSKFAIKDFNGLMMRLILLISFP